LRFQRTPFGALAMAAQVIHAVDASLSGVEA
jgi:hypothetical protein